MLSTQNHQECQDRIINTKLSRQNYQDRIIKTENIFFDLFGLVTFLLIKLFQWWAEFRDGFSTENYWQSIIWNNKDVRINNAPVFYKTFFESGIIRVNDLLFDLNNINSYNLISTNAGKVNFLTWAGLRHAIPSHLKMSNYTFMTSPPSSVINDIAFNVLKRGQRIITRCY